MNSRMGILNARKSIFMLCDLQEKFRSMRNFDAIVKNTTKLLAAGQILEIPLIATEQYPEKLGHTAKELNISHAVAVFPKTLFSMVIPEVKELLSAQKSNRGLESVVIFGLESHICVEQSAIDLRALGFDVHIVADCTVSRSHEDRMLAFERLRQMGCIITTSENVIFKLLRDKDHPKFNDVRKLVNEPSCSSDLAKL